MGFQQGLSGLDAASKNLDVIGSNVANANTVGYKKSTAEFGDVYARSLVGATDNQVGQGVNVTKVSQSFTQGNVTITGNPLDIAINGTGFYRLVDASSGQVSYSRNGQFQTDKNGFIISATGQNLTGYGGLHRQGQHRRADQPADSRQRPGTAGDHEHRVRHQPGRRRHAADDHAVLAHQLGHVQPFRFGAGVRRHGHRAHADQLLRAHRRRLGCLLAGGRQQPTGGNPVTSLTFNGNGQLTSTPSKISVAFAGMSIASMDFTGTTQYGGGYNDTAPGVTQDGYATGRLASYSVGTDGVITARYSNGRTATLGQVAMANFKAPEGLQNIGGNQWVETSNSGAPNLGTPGMGSFGLLQSSAVEQSNVDLSQELVNMIIAQRSYQANAQTIKTQDTILQTLVSM